MSMLPNRWDRALKGFLAGVIVLLLMGMTYQYIGTKLDTRRYLPPGELVDVGGHKLHVYCTGSGSPTVVLDAMAGGWSLYWSLVQPEVAKFTRVCSYDRAGYGWSEPGPAPRTGQKLAEELHALLAIGNVADPYVLVGHSLSGLTARLYRSQHPTDVAGLVLVDSAHEDQLKHEDFRKLFDSGGIRLSAFRMTTALGVPRFMALFGVLPPHMSKQLQQVPEEVRPILQAGWLRTQYLSTVAEETDAVEKTTEQVRATGRIGDVPLVVVTATGPVWWPDLPSGVNADQLKEAWLQLQKDLLKLSPNSSQIFADNSGHFVQFDQPDVVVAAIRRVIQEVRQTEDQAKSREPRAPKPAPMPPCPD